MLQRVGWLVFGRIDKPRKVLWQFFSLIIIFFHKWLACRMTKPVRILNPGQTSLSLPRSSQESTALQHEENSRNKSSFYQRCKQSVDRGLPLCDIILKFHEEIRSSWSLQFCCIWPKLALLVHMAWSTSLWEWITSCFGRVFGWIWSEIHFDFIEICLYFGIQEVTTSCISALWVRGQEHVEEWVSQDLDEG